MVHCLAIPMAEACLRPILCEFGDELIMTLTTDGSRRRSFLLHTVEYARVGGGPIIPFVLKQMGKQAVRSIMTRLLQKWERNCRSGIIQELTGKGCVLHSLCSNVLCRVSRGLPPSSASLKLLTGSMSNQCNRPDLDEMLVDLEHMQMTYSGHRYSLTEIKSDSIFDNVKFSDAVAAVDDSSKWNSDLGESSLKDSASADDFSDSDGDDGYYTAEEDLNPPTSRWAA